MFPLPLYQRVLFLLLAGLPGACDQPADRSQVPLTKKQEPTTPAPIFPAAVRFIDVATDLGLDFTHTSGASPEKHFPETMGGGGAFLDFDGDGRLDVYAVNGTWISPPPDAPVPVNALYRQTPQGRFQETGGPAGVDDAGFGMGCAVGDYDSDGHSDLLVANFGPNVLYHNRGDATFAGATAALEGENQEWSTSAAFLDFDLDGDLDLYIANYVDYDPAARPVDAIPYMTGYDSKARPAVKGYPHPANFAATADRLYRNQGASFADHSAAAGLDQHIGKGLGVTCADYDLDGWPDIYVANDAVANLLFHNQGDGTFVEQGASAGVAYGQDGQMEAGMGTDWGDYDGDGFPDLVVTNFQAEPNSLYRNQGNGFFAVESFSSGTGLISQPFLGFGTHFFDCDNDGLLDLFVANGHVLDNVAQFDQSTTYPQRNLLFLNQGRNRYGKVGFADISRHAGPGFAQERPSRGSAVGDYDGDGDLDLLVFNLGQPLSLLRNESQSSGNWLRVKLVGRQSARDGIGARLRLVAGNQSQSREVRAASSYLSQSELPAHFGLGADQQVDSLEIRWPGGKRQVFTGLEGNRSISIDEDRGLLRR